MSNREIPPEDPELEPGEEPAGAETEWLLKELSGDSNAHSLKRVGISISKGPPVVAKGKVIPPDVIPAISGGKAFEAPLHGIDADRHALAMALAENTALLEDLRSACAKLAADSPESVEIYEKIGALNAASNAARIGLGVMEQINEKLAAIPAPDPDAEKLHRLGAWIISEVLKDTREAMQSKTLKSATEMILMRFSQLTLEFNNQYAAYKEKRHL